MSEATLHAPVQRALVPARQVACDSMETAGNVVQDMCSSLGIEELESTAHFPVELDALQATLEQVRWLCRNARRLAVR